MPPVLGNALQLLLVEPYLGSRSSTLRLLAEASDRMSVELVTSLEAAVARLRATDDLRGVLLDLSLPEARNLSAIDALLKAAPHIAIMVLARAGDQLLARRAVDRGASDYIVTDHIDTWSLCTLIAMMFQRRAIQAQQYVDRARAEITLNAIGDGVLTTDVMGNVTYLNAEAETTTGWWRYDAFARPLEEVFDVMDVRTGHPAPNPAKLAIKKNSRVRLTGTYILVSREGDETAIEQSASPMYDQEGRVVGAVVVFRDVVVSRERSKQMLHLAEHDVLTDLPNRLLFNDRLARSIALARRYQRKLGVLFVDCDRFKQVNDTLGHDAGDQLLRSVARRLQASVRESDTVSRHGGDEFLVLLSEVEHTSDARSISEKIVAVAAAPHDVDGHEVSLTISVGISVYPDDGEDAQTLIRRADAAMYQAKASGRNQVCFWQAAMEPPMPEGRSIDRASSG
jgi:diguanylate cyclase (GGDEF)-like protein/PAS domain S-box-containing protein